MVRDKVMLHHLAVLEADVQQQLHLTEEPLEPRSLFRVELGLVELHQLLVLELMESLLLLV
jgi:hypothetical protein